jgi:hypothetical protein
MRRGLSAAAKTLFAGARARVCARTFAWRLRTALWILRAANSRLMLVIIAIALAFAVRPS